jgi:hypothetical protein
LDIAAGATHLLLDDGKGKSREVAIDSSPSPVLTVTLSGAGEKLPVTVTANVPDGNVLINGSIRSHLANGARLMQLPPGTWTIKITHDGYQDSDEQKVQLKAGDTSPKKLDFTLAALAANATLSISAAPPEAAVFIDEVRAGTVNSAGTFTKDIAPGSHAILLRKAGFEEMKDARDFKAGETAKLNGAMKPMATLSIKILPPSARFTVRRDGDSADTVVANGQASPVHPGSYKITAEADNFDSRSETIQIEAGKSVSIDWQLHPTGTTPLAKKTPETFFENGAAWKPESGWWAHDGKGYSFLRSSQGTFVFDLLKDQHSGIFKKVKKIVFVADYKGERNKIVYTLDGHNLARRVYTDGAPGDEAKKPHGMEANASYRIMVELKPESITIKNAAGKVLDTVARSGAAGKFGFQDEIAIAPLGR